MRIKQQLIPIQGIYYSEIDLIYVSTHLATVKYRMLPNYFIFFSDITNQYTIFTGCSEIILYRFKVTFAYDTNKDLNGAAALISEFIDTSVYGDSARFRIYGRGFKAIPYIYSFLFKLGYPDAIFYSLPIYVKIRKKRKNQNFVKFTGVYTQRVQMYLNNIKALRIPDRYCAKGLFKNGEYFVKKEGKKAFIL